MSAVVGNTTATQKTLSFTYEDGIRKTKTVDGVTHTYYYSGGVLVMETWEDEVLYFLYDESASPYAFVYFDGTNYNTYYYLKNLQGDVICILDKEMNILVLYTYDAWGNILGTYDMTSGMYDELNYRFDYDHIAYINPFRYRGYYYDNETNLYYLQSRYYDPATGRFINADGYVSTGTGLTGYNMFAYCNNNPVMFVDPTGTSIADFVKGVVAFVGKAIGLIIEILTYKPPSSVSDNGANFIASYEGFSATPYYDDYGNLTIGYGHLVKDDESFDYITQEEALNMFKSELPYYENVVSVYMSDNNLRWNQNQFDAMVSVTYNSGPDGFYKIADKLVAEWDVVAAFTWFYTQDNAKNGGTDLGLWRRRMDECDIFLFGSYVREDRLP